MLGGYKPMVSAIQLIEIDSLKHRDRATKPMVYIHQTYGLEGREETWRNKKVSNLLTNNGLETLRKYGRISEKYFAVGNF